jgi:hypothetical protein
VRDTGEWRVPGGLTEAAVIEGQAVIFAGSGWRISR